MIEFCNEDKIAYHKKFNELMKAVKSPDMDWTPDGKYTIKDRSTGKDKLVHYITIGKLQKNLIPLALSHGMNMIWKTRDMAIIGDSLNKFLTVQLDVTFVDMDTGYSETATSYGGCTISSEKAVTYCQSYAARMLLNMQFGITLDDDDVGENTPSFGRSQTEMDEVRSRVLDAGIKPVPKPIPAVKPAVKPAPAPAKAPAEPAEPKEDHSACTEVDCPVTPTGEPAKELSEGEKRLLELKAEKEAMEAEKAKAFEMSKPQKNVVQNIYNEWRVNATNGTVTPEEFEAMEAEMNAIGSAADVRAFVNKYKVKA